MENKEALIFAFIAVLVVAMSSVVYFDNSGDYITGNAVVAGGVDSGGDKESSNPDKGVIKGTVTYVIKDGDTIVNREYAENATIYFAKTGNTVSNYSKIILSSKEYKNSIVTIDVDGFSDRCSQTNYTTFLNYYDENGNSQEDGGEFDVYKAATDASGCYAAKLKGGSYDIYT